MHPTVLLVSLLTARGVRTQVTARAKVMLGRGTGGALTSTMEEAGTPLVERPILMFQANRD